MKRFDYFITSGHDEMVEDPTGEYVLFEEADQAVKNALRIALCALAQYGDSGRVRCLEEDGQLHFELRHSYMVAGQELFDLLEQYGLAEDSGAQFYLTAAGISLMEGLIPG